jgi:transposase
MRKEPVVKKDISWVGLDAHKRNIAVAVLWPGRREAEQWEIENTPKSVERLLKKLEKEANGGEVRCCYEAGPCGYALQRQLEKDGRVVCEVIAPSLIPSKPGERIKTDRRDALKLAQLLKAGLLTAVQPPSEEQEAVRDLCRCREDAREDLHRVRHRLLKFLLRRGHIFNETSRPWSEKHRRWLKGLSFENAVDQSVLDEYLLAVAQTEQRLKALDQKLEEAAQLPIYKEPVGWLRCFRGIDTITAMIFAAELHGIERFDNPRKLAAYLGVVPSEYSSSDKTRRGSITKTGNRHIRRALVQACWQYRHRAGVGSKLAERRRGQPPRVIGIADAAQRRLCSRYARLSERGKPKNKVVIAIVRELVGFLWAALHPSQLESRTRRAT